MDGIWSAMSALNERISLDSNVLLLICIIAFLLTVVLAIALTIVLSSKVMNAGKLAYLAQKQWRDDLNMAFGQGNNLLLERIKTELLLTKSFSLYLTIVCQCDA